MAGGLDRAGDQSCALCLRTDQIRSAQRLGAGPQSARCTEDLRSGRLEVIATIRMFAAPPCAGLFLSTLPLWRSLAPMRRMTHASGADKKRPRINRGPLLP